MTQAINLALLGNNVNASGQVSLTAGVSGTLPVASGGTGTTTLAANNVLLGNGTSGFQVVAPGASGNLLTSNGTTWTSATLTAPAPTTAQVLTATAGASAGAVGTYAFGRAGSNIGFGGTLAGSSIQPTAAPWASSSGVNTWSFPVGTALSGTWRAMGTQTAVISGGCGNYQGATLWLRIS